MNTEQKQELFRDVAESNLAMFSNGFKTETFNYSVLESHKLSTLSEDEVRHLAVNFFLKELMKQANKNIELYFDKKITPKL